MKRAAKYKPVTPDLRGKIKRLLVLHNAHMSAIQGGCQQFYHDGRHQELLDLMAVVNPALGIRPWDDEEAILLAALVARDGNG